MSMVRDMGMACGEDSKRTFQGWSIVIITRRKTTKMENLCLKTTIYSRRELLNSVLPAMPHATWYQRPRVINLLQLSPSSQLGTPRKVTKWKWYPCNGFCILLLSVLIFSWSIRCYHPWGSNMSQCDFLIWKNLCTISIAARTSCLIVTPWKGQLLSRKNGGKKLADSAL